MRGMAAGIVAAGVWAAAEPALGRAFGIPWYSDRGLLGGLLRVRPEAAIAIHLVNGAIFGATFERLGLRGPVKGVVMAQAESLGLWPWMAVVDRVHQERRAGTWPPLLRNGRVFAYEVTVHALFGAVLGGLLSSSSETAPSPGREVPAAPR
ncbi:MAG TPA: hypothetical protein VJU01_08855 [Gaiellaceae bacterium]|nr:hypothetical protein [Gaiellaceae bacterium]